MDTQEKQGNAGETTITERWKITLTKEKIINVEVMFLGNKNHTRRISNM